IAALVWMRSRTNPRFDGGWVWPAALLLAAGVWLSPIALNVVLVYVHPLIALVLLDRELRRSHPQWRRTYHVALPAIPVLLGVLYWHRHDAPNLEGTDPLTLAFNSQMDQEKLTDTITNHAGSNFIEGISSHFLVAAHTFLEMVHYGVWVV